MSSAYERAHGFRVTGRPAVVSRFRLCRSAAISSLEQSYSSAAGRRGGAVLSWFRPVRASAAALTERWSAVVVDQGSTGLRVLTGHAE